MPEETTRPAAADTAEVSLVRAMEEALSEASQQYETYLQLAIVAKLAATATTRDEVRSYRRTWTHPLGLVMNASVEPTSR